MLNIVIVEDHDLMRTELVSFLTRPGWLVRGVDSGQTLDEALREQPADIVVLDLNLPFEDGLSIARRLRDASPQMGIVMLTARARPDERAQGYSTGADVYLTKPAHIGELESVITNLSRRVASAAAPLVLHLGTQRLVKANGQSVRLTPTECQMVAQLASAPDQTLPLHEVLTVNTPGLQPNVHDAQQATSGLLLRLAQKLALALMEPDLVQLKPDQRAGLSAPVRVQA